MSYYIYVIILLYYNQSSTSIYFALLYMSAILQYIIIRANLESAVHIFNHKVFWPREYKLFICIYRYV